MGLGKIFSGRPDETEPHVKEALRLSPRDDFAFEWMMTAGAAKLHLRADEEAVTWLGRSIESDRNWPLTHFFLAAALANLGRLEEARAATQAGLALDPTFTIHHLCKNSAKFCKQSSRARLFAVFSTLNALRPRKSERNRLV